MRLLKLVPDDTNYDFLRWRKLASFMSFFLVVVSIALVAVKGLNRHDILAAFETRIGNGAAEEFETGTAQVEKIAWLRLSAMLPEG